MNHNMRKMYTEQEVVELIKQAISSGEISGGTKLYKHSIDVKIENDFSISMIIISNNETIVDTPTKLEDLVSTSVSGKFTDNNNDNEYGSILLFNYNGVDLLVWYFSENDESPKDFNEDITEAVIEDTVTPL